MKTTALCLATLLIAAGVCLAESNPLVGTWELLSATGTIADGRTWKWEPKKAGGRSIKIFSGTHFAVVTHGPDGAFSNASAGPYVLKDKAFTETQENSSKPENVGTVWRHQFAVSGDLLTSSFVSPVSGAKATEVWRRVK